MDERDWNDKPLDYGEKFTLGNATVIRKTIGHMLLISGAFGEALKKVAPSTPIIGLGEDVGSDDYALRLGRDTILMVSKGPINLEAGWHEDGYAVSEANGKYAMLEVSGTSAESLLAQGTAISFKSPSPSAMIQFAGQNCILARQLENWLLFTELPMLTFVCGYLAPASVPQQESFSVPGLF